MDKTVMLSSSFKSKLQVCDQFYIYLLCDPPNWWWRLWHWLLLGFKWTKVVDKV